MKNLTNRWVRPTEERTMLLQFSRMHLVRTFVETGDERCPIAGIWSRLENDAPADDSELTRPAMRRFLPWRALLPEFRFAVYSSSFETEPFPMTLRPATILTLSLCLLTPLATQAQSDRGAPTDATTGDPPHAANAAPTVTIFPHPEAQRWLVSGQANIIFQAHPGFHSPYSGPNSMLARGEYKTSLVGTLFTGLELHGNLRYNTDAIFDLESSGGRGISEALGLAGFTNLDVVRNPQLGPVPYVARAQIHQTIGLPSKMVDAQRTQFSLATKVPERRLDLRVGKMSLPDIFDQNNPGSDSHQQFLNWTVDNNGAYDYAADTRGYTYAAVLEYDDGPFTARYGMALMPTVANGIDMQSSLKKARGDNYEVDYARTPLARFLDPKRQGAIRLHWVCEPREYGGLPRAKRKGDRGASEWRPDSDARHYRPPVPVDREVWRGDEFRAGVARRFSRVRAVRLE